LLTKLKTTECNWDSSGNEQFLSRPGRDEDEKTEMHAAREHFSATEQGSNQEKGPFAEKHSLVRNTMAAKKDPRSVRNSTLRRPKRKAAGVLRNRCQ
jgi:hypothetical protein